MVSYASHCEPASRPRQVRAVKEARDFDAVLRALRRLDEMLAEKLDGRPKVPKYRAKQDRGDLHIWQQKATRGLCGS